MPLPIIDPNHFVKLTETEYPIGKYKSGEIKYCYICNEKFYVGELFINSSHKIKEREDYIQILTNEFGNDVAKMRLSKMSRVKCVMVHQRCERNSNKLVNLIYSPNYSCIYKY